jgi:hypothetical protein
VPCGSLDTSGARPSGLQTRGRELLASFGVLVLQRITSWYHTSPFSQQIAFSCLLTGRNITSVKMWLAYLLVFNWVGYGELQLAYAVSLESLRAGYESLIFSSSVHLPRGCLT